MTKNCIAIIPVRGGSKGIPRKNSRLINGKPLMAYVIESAFEANCFSDVIVSTEDEELTHIAQSLGTTVIQRPDELAQDHIGLDEVIIEAVSSYENQKNIKVDMVATIQVTCPFLKSETILNAVDKCIEEALDTVLTVKNNTHLTWKLNHEGKSIPNYEKRLNRQLIPPCYTETGGIVVCTRYQLQKGTRFGQNTGIIEIDKIESLDIDDRFDWWIAQKQFKRKKILFRVEGYHQIGLGHIYRCITLADSMIDHDIVFLISKKSKIGIEKIRSRFYPIVEFYPGRNQEILALESCKPDIVINDILDTDPEYIRALKELKYRVINFEDQGEGRKYADAVINAMYDKISAVKEDNIFAGPEYVCLRDEFYLAKPITFKESVVNILLLFGGTDQYNLTEKFLRWIQKIDRTLNIIIIIGTGYMYFDKLTKYIEESKSDNIKIISDTNIITKYMERVDLAITSGGRTVFELATLGIPMIVLNQNQREELHVFAQEAYGVISLGLGRLVQFDEFKRTFLQLLNSPILRKKMHESLLSFNFKYGITRIWSIILGEIEIGETHESSF